MLITGDKKFHEMVNICFLQRTKVNAWAISAKLKKIDLKHRKRRVSQQNSPRSIKMTRKPKIGARTVQVGRGWWWIIMKSSVKVRRSWIIRIMQAHSYLSNISRSLSLCKLTCTNPAPFHKPPIRIPVLWIVHDTLALGIDVSKETNRVSSRLVWWTGEGARRALRRLKNFGYGLQAPSRAHYLPSWQNYNSE